MFKEILLVMCLVALSAFVNSQPIDDLEVAAVEQTNPQVADAVDGSEDLVGAENRFGFGGYGGYGGYGRGYGGWGGHRGYGGWGGHRGYGGYGGHHGYGGYGWGR